jgi:phage-related protein
LRVQRGDDPVDWKPMSSIGPGVRELRARDEAGIFRLIYVAKIADRIFVLHCFQKKTQRTAKPDLALAAKRYAELLKKEKNG